MERTAQLIVVFSLLLILLRPECLESTFPKSAHHHPQATTTEHQLTGPRPRQLHRPQTRSLWVSTIFVNHLSRPSPNNKIPPAHLHPGIDLETSTHTTGPSLKRYGSTDLPVKRNRLIEVHLRTMRLHAMRRMSGIVLIGAMGEGKHTPQHKHKGLLEQTLLAV